MGSALALVIVSQGCQPAGEAPADEAAPAPAMVAVAPEAPHPPGGWLMLDDAPQLWADTAALTTNEDGSVQARLLRWGVGHWSVTVQDIRCATREVRWVAEEQWEGDQPIESDDTADKLDDWQATTPGGPRGRIAEAICAHLGDRA